MTVRLRSNDDCMVYKNKTLVYFSRQGFLYLKRAV